MISKQKRGQITIFVILGIVLLIVAGGFLYMRSQAIDDQGQQEVDELTPQEFGHVKKFVDTCVYEIAKEGLMIIGEKGGYVNPLQSGVMAVPGFPTKGNGFEFAPQTNLLIPYWYYMSSADSCVTNCDFESKQPMLSGNSVNSIESQLRRYVANNINNCLKDFEDFKEQGLDIERSEKVDVIIIIGDESIVITLDNSLTIKQDDQLVTISKFTAELDVKLKQMYELATQIVNYESSNNTKFLEMFTREVIALGSMGSDKKIPPMRGLPQINLKGSDYWLLPDVKSELENQLMMNIPTLQLLFSRNSAIFETGDPYIDATYNMRIISLDPEVADPLMINQFKTNFVYLGWWPIYLKVKPGSQVIRPEVLGWRTSRFSLGISLFDFAYDVSYPVMVVLEDEQAFKGEGFTLQFGLETNLRNNHPISSLPLQFEI